MKKLLHVLTLVLTLTLILGFAGCSGNEEENYSKGLAFELNSDGTSYSVSGMGTCTDSEIIIPSTYNKLPVTAIKYSAFENYQFITKIEIPNSITDIGYNAFEGCDNLNYNEYDNGLYLDNGKNKYFYLIKANSTSINSCTINKNCQLICYKAFRDCNSLTDIEIPNSVTSIGESAFYDCSSLTSVTIPNSVTSIGEWAFYNCRSLTSITIPNSVTSIGDSAFNNCYSLTSIEIPNSVTSIGNYAFCDCSSLTSITIPNSVTSIGDYAFYNCSSLSNVTIPNSVTSIGDSAFNNCYSLTNITYNGTKSQWQAISKGRSYNVPASEVKCTDGSIKFWS